MQSTPSIRDEPDAARAACYPPERFKDGVPQWDHYCDDLRGAFVSRETNAGYSKEDAEDIVQNAYISVAKKYGMTVARGNVKPCLMQAVKRQEVEHYRSSVRGARGSNPRRISTVPFEGDIDRPVLTDFTGDGNGIVGLFEAGILSLDETQLLWWHYVDGWSEREISRRLGVSPSCISYRKNRIHKKLYDALVPGTLECKV